MNMDMIMSVDALVSLHHQAIRKHDMEFVT